MQYLMIQNPGVAPIEGYTLLGMSTTRDCGVAGTSGQFGSGAKHAINLLLRAGLKLYIYCGRTRLEFFTKDETVNDGLTEKRVRKVMCQMGGTSSKLLDLGWCLDFGSIDWTDLGMGLREFIANAIDRTIRQEGDFVAAKNADRLAVTVVDESRRRAKDDYTRIFIELSPEVQRYYGELPRRFLHFSHDPSQVHKSILPKADRNLSNGLTPMVYRCGVLVREIAETKDRSLFDYNFKPTELKIDESRNSSEYTIRAACARLISAADAATIATVFTSLLNNETTFESGLDPYYLCPSWEQPSEEKQEAWQGAWQEAAGDAVLCDSSVKQAELVERKGYETQSIRPSAWILGASQMGIKTADRLLSENEKNGKEILPATKAACSAVEIVWGWIVLLQMTQGKMCPQVACYRDIMHAESETHGFQDGDHVYIRDDIASGMSTYLLKTTLEEVVHYVTGATDNSRDFQQFLIDMIVAYAA